MFYLGVMLAAILTSAGCATQPAHLICNKPDSEYNLTKSADPLYPVEAFNLRIEGFVLLEFTLSKEGSPSNIGIIESQPPGVFDSYAISAMKKHEYSPRIINCNAIDIKGLRRKFTFSLDD